jgi:hypothetical protein
MEQVKKQRADSGTSTKSGNSPRDHIDDETSNKVNALKQNTPQETKSEPKTKTKISTKTDLLVYNATLPKHYAYGNVAEGTNFIKSVCKELNKAYKNVPNNVPLSQMITKINKRVEKTEIQVADPIYRLKKEVYFSPKNVSVAIFILFILFYCLMLNSHQKRSILILKVNFKYFSSVHYLGNKIFTYLTYFYLFTKTR